jgi:predicted phosphodiesterase
VVGVVSDTHLGSKHCMRARLASFIRCAYRRGARHILHAGDVLDGCYKHGRFELSHTGLEAQALDLLATLPRLDGLSYHAIDGNHDDTFSDSIGLEAGAYVEQLFRARGRTDFHHHGRRSAFVRLGGAVVHLWHPQGSCGASVEPRVRQKIESYAPGERPDVLLVGHWHRYVHTTARGVEGIACPTFQAGQSAFGKSLVTDPALGGLLLSWSHDRAGRMASFRVERRRIVDPKRLDELDAFRSAS